MSAERPCAFCGHTDRKITNEHVWPNWVRKLFQSGKTTVAQHRHNDVPRQYVVIDDMGVTVNDVCEVCNHGWMDGMEQAVRPLLELCIQRGMPRSFDSSEQAVISRWATKCALVVDLLSKPEARYFHSADRLTFGESSTVEPIETYVWIAAHHWRLSLAIGVDVTVSYDVQEGSTRDTAHLYCVTITLGYFAFQVLFVRRPPNHSRWRVEPGPPGNARRAPCR